MVNAKQAGSPAVLNEEFLNLFRLPVDTAWGANNFSRSLSISDLTKALKREANGRNVHVLENNAFIIADFFSWTVRNGRISASGRAPARDVCS